MAVVALSHCICEVEFLLCVRRVWLLRATALVLITNAAMEIDAVPTSYGLSGGYLLRGCFGASFVRTSVTSRGSRLPDLSIAGVKTNIADLSLNFGSYGVVSLIIFNRNAAASKLAFWLGHRAGRRGVASDLSLLRS